MDLISRQDAIDALSQYPFEKVVNCVSIIEELPSAQPERIKGHFVNITDGKNNVAKNYPAPYVNEEPPTDGCYGCKHRIIRSVPTSMFYCDLDDAFHDNLTNCPLEQDAPSASEIRGAMFYADMGDDE